MFFSHPSKLEKFLPPSYLRVLYTRTDADLLRQDWFRTLEGVRTVGKFTRIPEAWFVDVSNVGRSRLRNSGWLGGFLSEANIHSRQVQRGQTNLLSNGGYRGARKDDPRGTEFWKKSNPLICAAQLWRAQDEGTVLPWLFSVREKSLFPQTCAPLTTLCKTFVAGGVRHTMYHVQHHIHLDVSSPSLLHVVPKEFQGV